MNADRLTLEQRNARSVVTTWRKGDHLHAWGAAAADRPPSETNRCAARAFTAVAETADHQADVLQDLGFLPGHEIMRELRGIASKAAHRANRAAAWANELEEAERES